MASVESNCTLLVSVPDRLGLPPLVRALGALPAGRPRPLRAR